MSQVNGSFRVLWEFRGRRGISNWFQQAAMKKSLEVISWAKVRKWKNTFLEQHLARFFFPLVVSSGRVKGSEPKQAVEAVRSKWDQLYVGAQERPTGLTWNSEGRGENKWLLHFFLRFLKSLLNLLQHCFCFMFWCCGLKACEISAPWLTMESISPASEGKVLPAGLSGKFKIPKFWTETLWECRYQA